MLTPAEITVLVFASAFAITALVLFSYWLKRPEPEPEPLAEPDRTCDSLSPILQMTAVNQPLAADGDRLITRDGRLLRLVDNDRYELEQTFDIQDVLGAELKGQRVVFWTQDKSIFGDGHSEPGRVRLTDTECTMVDGKVKYRGHVFEPVPGASESWGKSLAASDKAVFVGDEGRVSVFGLDGSHSSLIRHEPGFGRKIQALNDSLTLVASDDRLFVYEDLRLVQDVSGRFVCATLCDDRVHLVFEDRIFRGLCRARKPAGS